MNPFSGMVSGQITTIPKPELRGFWGDSLTKLPFKVTSAEVAIICPDGFDTGTNFHMFIFYHGKSNFSPPFGEYL